jgi:putative two-component system response regulator
MKIILVDDSPIILKLARNALMSRYDVFTVPSAGKLFQFLERTIPDLILLDILMPDVNGYEAIEILKKNEKTADIPVIFLTSKSDTESDMDGLALGAADYITKPFPPRLLLKRVDVHMLVETQRRELKKLGGNLMKMAEEKAGDALRLHKAALKIISDLVEFRKDITCGHVGRVEHFLGLLLDEMKREGTYRDTLCAWDAGALLQSSQLHDIGKISVSDSILLKPGRLTDDDFDEVKKHAAFGEAIIEKIQRSAGESVFLAHAKIMAGTHHERWDGTGYPRGMAGSGIPLQGRMMAIADVYDALVSERPYKKAFTHEQAVEIIRSDGGRQFDPVITEVFVNAADRFA